MMYLNKRIMCCPANAKERGTFFCFSGLETHSLSTCNIFFGKIISIGYTSVFTAGYKHECTNIRNLATEEHSFITNCAHTLLSRLGYNLHECIVKVMPTK